MPIGHRNPQIQRLRRLSRRRSARLDEGAFVIEGPVALAEALAAGCRPTQVFVEDGADEPDLLAALDRAGLVPTTVAPGVLAAALDAVSPRPVAAVLPLLATPLDAVLTRPSGLVVVPVDLADPGNAGTIIRSAEAFGARAVVFAGSSVDVHNPKVVRAAAGSLLRLPVVPRADPAEVLDAAGWQVVATVVDGGEPYDDVNFTEPTILLLGNEGHGLAPATVRRVRAVTIPMTGPTESLNVAMAATAVLAEAARQRRAHDQNDGS